MSGAGEPSTRRQCAATSKRTGQRCGNRPIPGGTVCRFHGGATPVIKAAAARRLALAAAEREVTERVATSGPLTLRDVYAELARTGAMAVAWRDVLAERVDTLAGQYATEEGGGWVRADVQLLERALDRTARVLELIARLDLDARVAALDARTGDALARVIRRVIERAEMTDDARRDALERIAPAELRRVGEGW